MAKPSIQLIRAIRNTAKKLETSANYQWGHMGSCNCGFLAQEISRLDKDEIHERAMQRYGDWNEQLNDYCPTSGLLMDDLISELLNAGLDIDDLKHLEKLSDPVILNNLPSGKKYLMRNHKSDVVEYLNTWAKIMENKLVACIKLDVLAKSEAPITVSLD